MNTKVKYKWAFVLAAIDLWCATICAAKGDVLFVCFIFLAGLMWAMGTVLKKQAENEQEN
jgi:hypothetical protein